MVDSAKQRPIEHDRMPELDGIRAIAILLVISFHSWYMIFSSEASRQYKVDLAQSLPWFMAPIRRGDMGVDLFFVLSAFLLADQLFRQRNKNNQLNFRNFFISRLFRIYPVYLFALFLAMLAQGFDTRVFANIFAYNIWTTMKGDLIPWSWSLSVELNFYLLVPFLILFVRGFKSLMVLTCAMLAISIGWSAVMLFANEDLFGATLADLYLSENIDAITHFHEQIYVAFPVRLGQFIAGIVAAWVVANRLERLERLSKGTVNILLLLSATLITVPLFHNPYGPSTEGDLFAMRLDILIGRPAFAFGIALLILLMRSGHIKNLRRLLSAPILKPVARYSFSMYLFHSLFVSLGFIILSGFKEPENLVPWQLFGAFPIAVGLSMAFGYVTWKLLEHPCIRLGKRLRHG